MIGDADLPQQGRTHELKKAEAGLAVRCAIKIAVLRRQDRVTGVAYRPVALQIGVDQPVQIGIVLFELFQIAVGLIAGENRRKHKGAWHRR